jgi:hypothetical protein
VPTPSRSRVLVGLAVWAGLALAAWVGARNAQERLGDAGTVAAGLWRFAARQPPRATVRFPPGTQVLPGDAVCVRDSRGLREAGQVRSLSDAGDRIEAVVEFFDPDGETPARDARFAAVPNDLAPAWTLEVLLPPERRAHLAAQLNVFAKEHSEEILRTFWPPAELFLRDAAAILEEDLPRILLKRDDQVQKILQKHRDTTFQKEMLPVLKEEAWPRVQERAKPLIEDIGEELWGRLPKWELGWRYVYGQLPFTDSEIMRRRWNRYMEEEAIPVLGEHTDDFLAVVEEVFSDLAANRRVTDSVRKGIGQFIQDPDFAALVREIFLELSSSESRLVASFRERFSSPEFAGNLNRLMESLGPTLEACADRILLDQERGAIHPELARVLRRQIFLKDACWVLLEPGTGEPAPPGTVFEGRVLGWREGVEMRRAGGVRQGK